MQQDKLLRCYAEKSDGLWIAVCIDLSLAAQADTMVEAKQKLHGQIVDYVQEAVTVDRQHAYQLLNRKAPLSQILRYHWIKLMCYIHSKKNGNDTKCLAFEEEPRSRAWA